MQAMKLIVSAPPERVRLLFKEAQFFASALRGD
jgi:hypothetical protein